MASYGEDEQTFSLKWKRSAVIARPTVARGLGRTVSRYRMSVGEAFKVGALVVLPEAKNEQHIIFLCMDDFFKIEIRMLTVEGVSEGSI